MSIYGNTEDLNQLLEKKNFMDNLLNKFDSVKGFLAEDEGIFLYNLTREFCVENFAVEIGSYCGKSACYIGQACKENKTYLLTIDHHMGSEEQQFGEEYFDPEIYDEKLGRVNTVPLMQANLQKFEESKWVVPILANANFIAPSWGTELGILFIDGSHTEKSAMNDYDNWHSKLHPDGALLIHDIYEKP